MEKHKFLAFWTSRIHVWDPKMLIIPRKNAKFDDFMPFLGGGQKGQFFWGRFSGAQKMASFRLRNWFFCRRADEPQKMTKKSWGAIALLEPQNGKMVLKVDTRKLGQT